MVSAHLTQQWAALADPDVQEVKHLRRTRNSIEHLTEAQFDDLLVVARSRSGEGQQAGAWDIKKLPEGHLVLGLGKRPLEMVFDSVSLQAIVDFARDHAHRGDEDEVRESGFLLEGPDFPSRSAEP